MFFHVMLFSYILLFYYFIMFTDLDMQEAYHVALRVKMMIRIQSHRVLCVLERMIMKVMKETQLTDRCQHLKSLPTSLNNGKTHNFL